MPANTLINIEQGGATMNVESGGVIAIEAASGLTIGGVAPTGNVRAGEVTLDGTNPTPVTTGLASISSVAITLKTDTAPGDDPSWFSYDTSGGTLNIYAWKYTSGTDPTLVASTNNTAVVGWVAVGV